MSAQNTDDQAPALDRLAPLTPNAWLRYDLLRRMIPAEVKEILEVGCGQGSLGTRLAAKYDWLGVEPDPESYAIASQRVALGGRGEIRNTRIEDLEEGRQFDMVCAFEVLEHIEDDAGALKGWSQRLRPGGWLMLSVPAHQKRFAAADQMAGHFRRYDREPMTAMLQSVGFTDVTIREYGVPLGYLLEAGRNAMGRRKIAATPDATMEQRTSASGRLFQPSGGLQGAATRWGTAPFRVVQRSFPNVGTGLVARAKLPA
ncbi:MAG: class I SAM-dependent methyltransferase [Actinocrinis sp.]